MSAEVNQNGIAFGSRGSLSQIKSSKGAKSAYSNTDNIDVSGESIDMLPKNTFVNHYEVPNLSSMLY